MDAVRRINLGEAEMYRRIRLAALKDAPEAFATTYEAAAARTEESWQRQADEATGGNDRAIFFATSDGEAVGLVALYRDGDLPHSGELLQMWVAPGFRGKGFAKQLIAAAADWARKAEFKTVKAVVTGENRRAMAFYRKCGFIQTTSDPQLPLQEFTLEL
jgi:RimJ/RimL family protein N-acetyltransferase